MNHCVEADPVLVPCMKLLNQARRGKESDLYLEMSGLEGAPKV
jgi:hypothetical protein